MAQRRLTREFRHLTGAPIPGVEICVSAVDIKLWCVTIEGPENSPYEGCTYSTSFLFPDDYPFSPPTVTVITPILHPNISHRGDICLPILNENWSASNTARKIIEQLLTILAVPNVDDPLNVNAASLYVNDYPEFVRRVTEIQDV